MHISSLYRIMLYSIIIIVMFIIRRRRGQGQRAGAHAGETIDYLEHCFQILYE